MHARRRLYPADRTENGKSKGSSKGNGGGTWGDRGSEAFQDFAPKGCSKGYGGSEFYDHPQRTSNLYNFSYSPQSNSMTGCQRRHAERDNGGDVSTSYYQPASSPDMFFEQRTTAGLPLDVMDGSSSNIFGSNTISDNDIDDFELLRSNRTPAALTSSGSSGVNVEPPQANLALYVDPQSAEVQKHNAGTCKPCKFAFSKAGCRNGNACAFCHLKHHLRPRPRPSKSVREECRQIADMLETHVPDPELRLKYSNELGARSSYTRLLLKGKQRNNSGVDHHQAPADTDSQV